MLRQLFGSRKPRRHHSVQDLASLGDQAMGAGAFDQASLYYRELLAIDPCDEAILANLGRCHVNRREFDQAKQCFKALLEAAPESTVAHLSMGNYHLIRRRYSEAVACYRNAFELLPEPRECEANVGLINNLGIALQRQGIPEEAMLWFRKALQIQPGHLDARANLVFAMLHTPGVAPSALFDEYRRWAEMHETPLLAAHRPHAQESDPAGRDADRCLRIGYISRDFRQHAVANFIEPVLCHHDRSQFDVFCYSNRELPDEQTEILRDLSNHWREIATLSDHAVAERIRSDRIDILVDLSGHTLGNRLLVFARKPAPVQVTWLGYPTTTGMSSIDYRITDGVSDPAGIAEAFHSETLPRLPGCQWCYRPSREAPPLSESPAKRSGHVTFGSFNNVAKLNGEVLALWGRVMKALPNAAITVVGITDHSNQLRIASALVTNGAHPAQITLRGALPTAEFWRIREDIDIVLDAFPYNGTTTTCEALWAGLPVITLPGSHGAARSSTSLLTAIGLTQLVAKDAVHYIAIAVNLARDVDQLAALRAGMRRRMFDGGLCDGAAFTGELEILYRTAWRRWCDSVAEQDIREVQ